MPGLIPLPKIHLTKRAYQWLTGSTRLVGVNYTVQPGTAYCDGSPTLVEGWACAVGDVRALYLGLDYRVHLADQWKGEFERWDIKVPNCPVCSVALDKALETTIPKFGKWRDVDPDGTVRWRTYPEPSNEK